MADEFLDKIEQAQLFKKQSLNNAGLIFSHKGSSGRNPLRLAQILTTFDFIINLLKWQDKPLANLTNFLTQYQASIDAKYHNDYKDILIAEEVERRRMERKGLSIFQGVAEQK